MPAILIVLWPLHHLCSHRVQVNVSTQLAEVPIRLTENRLVPSLKHVPNLFVLAIVVLTIAGQDPLHDAANRIVLHLHQEVHVVGHQAIGVQKKGEFSFLVLEEAGKPEVIVV